MLDLVDDQKFENSRGQEVTTLGTLAGLKGEGLSVSPVPVTLEISGFLRWKALGPTRMMMTLP